MVGPVLSEEDPQLPNAATYRRLVSICSPLISHVLYSVRPQTSVMHLPNNRVHITPGELSHHPLPWQSDLPRQWKRSRKLYTHALD